MHEIDYLFYIVRKPIDKFKIGDILVIQITNKANEGDYIIGVDDKENLYITRFNADIKYKIVGKVITTNKKEIA